MSTPQIGVSNNSKTGANYYASKYGIPQNFYNQVQTGISSIYGQGQEAYFALQRQFLKYQFQSQLYAQIPNAIKEGSGLIESLGNLFKGGSKSSCGSSRDTQLAQNSGGPCGGRGCGPSGCPSTSKDEPKTPPAEDAAPPTTEAVAKVESSRSEWLSQEGTTEAIS